MQNYMENKNERNENKIILGDFNCTMDKMDRYGGNKTQNFIDAIPIMSPLWILAWESMEKGKLRIPWVSQVWQVFCQGARIYRVYTDAKIPGNTQSNHIMVSFTDH